MAGAVHGDVVVKPAVKGELDKKGTQATQGNAPKTSQGKKAPQANAALYTPPVSACLLLRLVTASDCQGGRGPR